VEWDADQMLGPGDKFPLPVPQLRSTSRSSWNQDPIKSPRDHRDKRNYWDVGTDVRTQHGPSSRGVGRDGAVPVMDCSSSQGTRPEGSARHAKGCSDFKRSTDDRAGKRKGATTTIKGKGTRSGSFALRRTNLDGGRFEERLIRIHFFKKRRKGFVRGSLRRGAGCGGGIIAAGGAHGPRARGGKGEKLGCRKLLAALDRRVSKI